MKGQSKTSRRSFIKTSGSLAAAVISGGLLYNACFASVGSAGKVPVDAHHPVWFIKTDGHQMVYMHIRDQKADGKWTEAVGEGVTDFAAIANALQQKNYSCRAAIELALDEPPKNPVKEDWKKSRDYVRKVLSGRGS